MYRSERKDGYVMFKVVHINGRFITIPKDSDKSMRRQLNKMPKKANPGISYVLGSQSEGDKPSHLFNSIQSARLAIIENFESISDKLFIEEERGEKE